MTLRPYHSQSSRGLQLRTRRACIRLGLFGRVALPSFFHYGNWPAGTGRQTHWQCRVWRFALAVGGCDAI